MLGIKLTILGIVLLLVTCLITKVCFMCSSLKTKLNIQHSKGPWWSNLLGVLIVIFGLADLCGLIYSVIWLLFFR